MSGEVESPLQYPVQGGRRIASGRDAAGVRDQDRVEGRQFSSPEDPDDDQAPLCGVCGRKIQPRSLRPGAPRCPKHRRDAIVPFIVYRGSETPTTAEERRRLQAQTDADRAAAVLPRPARELTREHVVEVAYKNGALKIVAARLQHQAAHDGRPVPDDDEALALAKEVVAEFGITSPANLPRPIVERLPRWKFTKLALGPNPYGRKIGAKAGGGAGGATVSIQIGPARLGRWRLPERLKPGAKPMPPDRLMQRRVKRDRVAEEAASRVGRLRAERLARQAMARLRADNTGNTDRQREAHTLVRVQGLRQAEAARRMGISRQTVADLLKKFDKTNKIKDIAGG